MNRSLRHPFKGSRRFGRPERERKARQKSPKQPKMRQSRFSVEAMLDAPDTSTSRPGLRIRVIALVVVGLFALLGLRLWALTVLEAPAAAQAANADQIRVVQIQPTRGLILDRYGNPLVNNVVTEQITLSRVAAIQEPGGGGPAGHTHRGDHRPGQGHHRRSPVQPVQAGADPVQRPVGRHPVHQRAPERVPRGDGGGHHPAELSPARTARAGPDGLSGVAGPRLRGDDQQRRAQVPGVAGLPGRRPLRPVGARVPVRVRAAGNARADSSWR